VEVSSDVNFDNPSNWTLTGQSTVSNGVAHILQDDTANTGVAANTTITNKTYRITGVVSDYVSGSVGFSSIGSTSPREAIPSQNGEFTIYYTSTRSTPSAWNIQRISSPCNLKIDNVSVKEVGQDWTFGTGWSITDGKVYFENPTGTEFYQSLSTTASKYRISFDLDITSGTIQTSFSSPSTSTVQSFTTSGTKTVDITTTASFSRFRFVGLGGSVFNIDNVSVIEITDDTNLPRINYEGFSYQDALGDELVTNGNFDSDSDWAKGTGWSISGGKANANNVPNLQRLQQGLGTSVVGKKYKYSLNITNVSGFYSVYIFGVYVSATSNTEGVIEGEVIATSTNGAFWVAGASASGLVSATVDNVSVKEYLGQEVVPDSGVGSWLFEPQSTNLIITSDSGVYGNNPGSEILTTSPDGTNTAVRPIPDSLSDRYTGQISGGTYATNTKITYSWYRKRISTPVIDTYVGDLQPNVLVNVTQVGSTIQVKSDINGFDRFSATFNISDGSLASNIRLYFGEIIGIGNSSVAYWGHQLEVGSFATSIIPTNGSTVTRLQDAAFGAGSSDLINSTEGVLYFEGERLSLLGSKRTICISDGSLNNYLYIQLQGVSNTIRIFYKTIETGQVLLLNHNLSNELEFRKYAFRWSNNNFSLWINGIKEIEQLNGNTATSSLLNEINFSLGGGADKFFGKTKCVAVFKEALTDEELTCLTTI